MTSKGTTTVDDAPSAGELAFDHLIKMRMRLRGFAALMESAFENTLHFEHEQMQGVVQLTADLSERMDECYEAAVPIVISVDEARPAIIAIIEREAGR